MDGRINGSRESYIPMFVTNFRNPIAVTCVGITRIAIINVNATFFALDSMNTPTVSIGGGGDKGNDYTELMSLVREKVKAIICLGVDNKKIIDVFGNVVDIMVEVSTMTDAVKMAQRLTEKGDSVLLSPACASFDLFESYEDRGNQFKKAVKNL